MNISTSPLALSSTDMSNSTITSNAIWLGNIINYNIQIVFTGSPVGTFTLEVSDDDGNTKQPIIDPATESITNWSTYQGSSQSISAAGNHSYEVQNSGHRWARIKYTKTSGTGTITSCRVNIKGA